MYVFAFAAVACLASLTPAAARQLDAYRWTARVLVVIAPDDSDPRLAEQRRIVRADGAAMRERDLVLIEGVGTSASADALRQRFGIEPRAFRAILVGKDGDEKLSRATPIPASALAETIDAMPMRQDEMRRATGKRATR